MPNKKVFLFGIDGAPPELIFDKWKNELPNISKLMDQGSHARMESTIPPSTIVAWNSMISGKDTSELGIFSYTYKDEKGKSQLVNSKRLKSERMWDILDRNNKKTIALYVPLTYPVKPINGCMVSGFLTPGIESNCAYPESLKEKIKALGNAEYFFDVSIGLASHKGLEMDELIKRTYEMTEMQIKLLKDLIVNEEWDFFMSVMIGSDRLQHILWSHFDKTHRKHVLNSKYANTLKEYYQYLDKELGEIIKLLPEDTTIIVASDHGMVKQEGKININNWLIKEGYLKLKPEINTTEKTRFKNEFIDMDNTIAYGGGAYNARVYINKKKVGDSYNQIREGIIKKLKQIPDDKGDPLQTIIYKREEIYSNYHNPECPDLTVYFDDLRWASNPDLGMEGLYSWKTAVGADNAGHSREGCFIINKGGLKGNIKIGQVAPTILNILDVKIPEDITIAPLFKEKMEYPEATLIDTTDDMQFKVYANNHPEGFVIAKPKYIPKDVIDFTEMKKRFMFSKCVTRFNLFKSKEIVQANLNKLKGTFPEYIYYCNKHKNWFLGSPVNKIKRYRDPKEGLKQLMQIPVDHLDNYLKATRGIIDLMAQSGVSVDNLGISHSTLLGNYTPGKSDIDLLVFGKENGWKVIKFLETAQHPSLKWKTGDEWAAYYRKRIVSDFFSEQEYVANMVRKRDDGLFDGHVFSVFVVENKDEQWYNWKDEHEPLGTVKIKAKVKDNYNAIVRPGFYELEETSIIEGHENVPIKRIVTWSRPFVLQANKGETIEACGLLEKVKSIEGEYYQVVIGYFDTYVSDRGKQEYLKALI